METATQSIPSTDSSNRAEQNLLALVDSELHPLIEPTRMAIDTSQPVVALQLWRRTRYASLLPFHLHLRWPDIIERLPLTARITIVPFFDSDLRVANIPLYRVCDANLARRSARWERNENHRAAPGDFVHPDWEQAYDNHRSTLAHLTLPGASFLAIDHITPNGTITKGHRPKLGKFAVRDAPRPYILVPSRSGVATGSALEFAEQDLLIVNVQRLRGRRAVETVRRVLQARGNHSPTLILAASPTDVILTSILDIVPDAPTFPIGTSPEIERVAVTAVGKDRPQVERSFEFAIGGLSGSSTAIDRLVDLAKSAWWETRQGMDIPSEPEPAMRRFLSALGSLESAAPEEAKLLTACKDVIRRASQDGKVQAERRQAVIDAVINEKGTQGPLVVLRNGAAAATARTEISRALGMEVESLEELGVQARTYLAPQPSGSPDAAVVAGYFGLATLDSALASGARTIHFILDPVEARTAWYGARQMVQYLTRTGVTKAIGTLEQISKAVALNASGFAEGTEIDISLSLSDGQESVELPRIDYPPAADEIAVYLTDGTRLDVSPRARFDVLGRVGEHLRSAAAVDLQPDDEIVLVQEDSRALFSEQLMTVVDQGPLKKLAEKRSLWLTMVQSIGTQNRPNIRELGRQMSARGQPTDYAVIRSWVKLSSQSDAVVPARWARFLALAESLGVTLPEESLLELFRAIRKLRTLHRKAGRDLARVIRGAYANKLDAITLARVERDWGLSVRQLLMGARVGVVDEVILPEE